MTLQVQDAVAQFTGPEELAKAWGQGKNIKEPPSFVTAGGVKITFCVIGLLSIESGGQPGFTALFRALKSHGGKRDYTGWYGVLTIIPGQNQSCFLTDERFHDFAPRFRLHQAAV